MAVSEHGWVSWVQIVPAHLGRVGGPIKPRMLVWHCTDTAPGTGPAIVNSWHTQRGAGNGAHFVIDERGHVTQLVSIYHNSNHAGGKDHGTLGGMHPNLDTLGIELVNPGKGAAGANVSSKEPGLSGYWVPYTEVQLNSAKYLAVELAEVLGKAWTTVSSRIVHVNRPVDDPRLHPDFYADPLALRHYDINPIQKTDPGPLLDVKSIAAAAWKAFDEAGK